MGFRSSRISIILDLAKWFKALKYESPLINLTLAKISPASGWLEREIVWMNSESFSGVESATGTDDGICIYSPSGS